MTWKKKLSKKLRQQGRFQRLEGIMEVPPSKIISTFLVDMVMIKLLLIKHFIHLTQISLTGLLFQLRMILWLNQDFVLTCLVAKIPYTSLEDLTAKITLSAIISMSSMLKHDAGPNFLKTKKIMSLQKDGNHPLLLQIPN